MPILVAVLSAFESRKKLINNATTSHQQRGASQDKSLGHHQSKDSKHQLARASWPPQKQRQHHHSHKQQQLQEDPR
jgi:hypothetical protein